MLRLSLLVFVLLSSVAHAAELDAVLDRPDVVVKGYFPGSTSYRVRAVAIDKDSAPLTFYVVYKGSDLRGLIHGTAAVSGSGPMQVFVVYTKGGKIVGIHVQRISSAHAPHFRSSYYRKQYLGFSLTRPPEDSLVSPPVRLPSKEVLDDHHTMLAAVQKNIEKVKAVYNRIKE